MRDDHLEFILGYVDGRKVLVGHGVFLQNTCEGEHVSSG